jgi:glycerol kinase
MISSHSASRSRWPEVKTSAASFGHFTKEHLGTEIPITGILGDQQASLFGHGCFEPGMLKASFGTGGFVWLNAGVMPPSGDRQGLLATIAWQLDWPTYALEGFACMRVRSSTGCSVPELGSDPEAVARLAREVTGTGGVTPFPRFRLGSPWWMRKPARPSSVLRRVGSRRYYAPVEAICFQTARC